MAMSKQPAAATLSEMIARMFECPILVMQRARASMPEVGMTSDHRLTQAQLQGCDQLTAPTINAYLPSRL